MTAEERRIAGGVATMRANAAAMAAAGKPGAAHRALALAARSERRLKEAQR